VPAGRAAMVAPENAVLSTLRRDSLGMVDTPSVPKKNSERENIFSERLLRPAARRTH
jgi:hypothetical protein